MFLIIAALLVSAQAPAAAQAAPAQAPAAKKHKPAQICEDVELTGSRAKRHICHDPNVDAGALLGVSHSLYGKGSESTGNGGAANTGTGGPGGL